MRFLVTGAGGFLGSHLCELILEKDVSCELYGLVFNKGKTGNLRSVLGNPRFHLMELDIRDRKKLGEIWDSLKPIDVVFHLASVQPGTSYSVSEYLDSNTGGTVNVCRACAATGVPKMVFVSTMAVYDQDDPNTLDEQAVPRPSSSYGASKYAAELFSERFALETDLKVGVMRCSSIYGSRNNDGPIHCISRDARSSKDIILFANGTPRRDFVFVEDVVRALWAVPDALGDSPFEIFNVASGDTKTIKEVARIIVSTFRSRSRTVLSENSPPREFKFSMDITKLRERLNFHPLNLEDGIAAYKEQLEKGEKAV